MRFYSKESQCTKVLPVRSAAAEKFRDKKIAVLAPVAWRTPPRAYGAWETVASNVTEGLVRRGWNVTLFATGDSLTNADLRWRIPSGYEEDKTQIPKVSECLHISMAMESADEFDLIHNHYDYLPLTYSRMTNTPILTTIHGFSSPDILRVYRNYDNCYFVSISNSDRDAHLPYLGTVYNGIDLSQITFREKSGDKLVFLGRIHPDKGAHLAIGAAKAAGVDLIIAGLIQDQGYFDSMIKPHLYGSSVRYIGMVDVKARNDLFKDAAAVLHLNTIPERFGLVMAESMAAGVPVIATDLGSCREVIAHNKTGFLVSPEDPEFEAAKAVNLLDGIDRATCREHVEQNFSIEKMVAGYELIYEKIFALENQRSRYADNQKVFHQPGTYKR